MIFFDTNIFVYAFNTRDEKNNRAAREIIKKAIIEQNGAISTQVIAEFCNVMVKSANTTELYDKLTRIIEVYMYPMKIYTHQANFHLDVLHLHERHSLSFYDACIVQAALELGCDTLYSEDMQHGQKFGSLTVINPFRNPA